MAKTSKNKEIYLYGIIGKKKDIDTTELISEIEKSRKAGIRDFVFYVNSEGGEVSQGSSLFNYLDRTDIDVTWVVDGLAASMAALLISSPRHVVKAARHAKFMYHKVWGSAVGNSAEVRAYADMIDTFEVSLIEMMASRMNWTFEKVKSEFFDGVDHWLSAEEAKALGLVDEILVGGMSLEEPANVALLGKTEVYNFYNNQIINLKKMEKGTNIYALAMGLSEAEDDSVALARLQGIVAQNRSLTDELQVEKEKTTTLENRIRTLEGDKVKSLVESAIAERKITAEERDTYVSLAEKDFASVEKILNKMVGVAPIKGSLNTKGTASKYEGKSWDELDKSGRLASLRAEAPELYAQLYEEKFHLSPTPSPQGRGAAFAGR
jgi:ATP-dependent Clp endopeptidase proteolytic subunit ClpP